MVSFEFSMRNLRAQRYTQGRDFVLGDSLFTALNLIVFDKRKYSGYGIGFDAGGSSSLSNGDRFGKYIIIFGADMSSLVDIDNEKKNLDSW